MLTKIAKKNLKKDKRVLGANWKKVYHNYFSDSKNINFFIRTVKPCLPNSKLNVLYAASAAGLLGEKLLTALGAGNLTLVDISKKHLYENKNKKTRKIQADLTNFDLKEEFDLIIMRSSLDYLPSRRLQIKVLKQMLRHLKNGGILINQPAYVRSLKERDIMSQIYTKTAKIGDRLFQSRDLRELYSKAGFCCFKKIGEGQPLIISEKEHSARYAITQKDITKIQRMIPRRAQSLKITRTGYSLKFDFPIFVARKCH